MEGKSLLFYSIIKKKKKKKTRKNKGFRKEKKFVILFN